MKNKPRFLPLAMLCCILFWGSAFAAETLESSPWVGWRKGYEAYDRGGRMKEASRYREALTAYREAARYFDAVRRIFPDWNRTVIDGRIRLCEEEITNLTRLAGGSLSPAEPPQGTAEKSAYRTEPERERTSRYRSEASASRTGGSGSRLYVEMQSELEQYKQRWQAALEELDDLKIKLQQAEANRTDVEGLLRDYRKLQERYSLLEVQYENAKAGGGSAERQALQDQVLNLTRKTVEQQAQLTVRDEQLQRQAEEYAGSRREVQALKQQLEEAGNQVKRMERELSLVGSNSGTIAAKDAELLKLRTAQETLQAELNAGKVRIAELTAMLEKLRKADAGSSEKVLIDENKRLLNELELLRSVQNQSDGVRLQQRIDELTAAQTALGESLQRSTERVRQLEQENKLLNQKLTSERSEIRQSSTEHQMQQTRITQLEGELKVWQTRHAELDKRLQERLNADALSAGTLSEANRQLESKLAAAEKRCTELAGANEDLKKKHAQETADVAATRQQMLDLRTKAAAQEITEGKLAALQKAYDELAARQQSATLPPPQADEARLVELEETVKRYEAENRALHQKLERAAADLETLRKAPAPTAQAQQVLEQLSTVLAPEKIENLLADAIREERNGNEESAIWGYRQILARQPEHWEASFRLGKLLCARGDYAGAEPLLTSAAAARPDSAEAADALMRVLIARKKYDAALNCFKDFTKGRQPSGSLQLSEAVAWSRSGNAAEAERAFKAVLAADAANLEAATELAMLLSSQPDRLPEARQFYRQARSHGADADPYLEEALKAAESGDTASHEFLFRSALEAMQQQDLTTADWYLQQLQELQKNGDFTLQLTVLLQLYRKDYQGAGKTVRELPAGFDGSLFAAAAALGRSAIPAAETALQAAQTAKPADFRCQEPLATVWKSILQDLSGRCKTDAAKKALQQLNALLFP